MALRRRRIEVTGVVQGVGFRPFVVALGQTLGLSGTVANHSRGVSIEVEGEPERVAEFERRLVDEAPPLARVSTCVATDIQAREERPGDMVIVRSAIADGPRALVPPDTATCDDCLRELCDPADRRYRHPFITCTNCGPRLSIITDIPYDRPATTMAGFPLCAECAREYADPADRRHHAQPIACHDCGPTLTLRDAGGRPLASDEEALAAAQEALRTGRVVAVKGIGGYHLACDAASAAAVAVLRERKRRPDKPFALMVADLAVADSLIEVDETVAMALTGPDRPIVLARRRPGGVVCESVAPGLDELGVMLAYAPVHHLLLRPHPSSGCAAPPVLVMTSGNVGDEPLAFEDDDAIARLGAMVDVLLTHDRPIHVPVEDSVVAADERSITPIRRSRGHAPLPVVLPALQGPEPVVLAVGAEIKNTCALTRDGWAFLSAHVGDMGTLESQRAFARTVEQLLALHDSQPTVVAADLHPGYATHAWAQRWGEGHGIPLHLVQHHHAHLAALLAEHGRLGDRVLGIVLDGTGYGCDGAIWGGELLFNAGDVTAIRRLGHLAPFALPGGEVAVRRPVRIALSLLHTAGIDVGDLLPGADPAELALVRSQLALGGQPLTTSVGRLWDGLAALLGVRGHVTYEAQAAIEFEALARTASTPYAVSLPTVPGPASLPVLDTVTLVRDVVRALQRAVDRARIARGVHDALCEGMSGLTVDLAHRHDVTTVGLTGGAFQNALLRRGLRERLAAADLAVLEHRVVPCTDGGLSLGQAVVARAAYADSTTTGDRSCA